MVGTFSELQGPPPFPRKYSPKKPQKLGKNGAPFSAKFVRRFLKIGKCSVFWTQFNYCCTMFLALTAKSHHERKLDFTLFGRGHFKSMPLRQRTGIWYFGDASWAFLVWFLFPPFCRCATLTIPREARDLISKIRSCTVRSDLKNKAFSAVVCLFLSSDLTVQDRILEIRSLVCLGSGSEIMRICFLGASASSDNRRWCCTLHLFLDMAQHCFILYRPSTMTILQTWVKA